MVREKRYIIFAGINGVGKSTLFHSDVWDKEGVVTNLPRVNSDEIITQNGWRWDDGKAQIEAGKQAIRLINHYFETETSFNQETTLTGRSIMRNIARAKELGYRITLYYIGIEDPELANERIANRISVGGHGVDARTVRKRAVTSRNNLIEAVSLCDETFLFDNTYLMCSVAKLSPTDLESYNLELSDITWPEDVFKRLLALSRSTYTS